MQLTEHKHREINNTAFQASFVFPDFLLVVTSEFQYQSTLSLFSSPVGLRWAVQCEDR
jgi:hypothetical protein